MLCDGRVEVWEGKVGVFAYELVVKEGDYDVVLYECDYLVLCAGRLSKLYVFLTLTLFLKVN